MYQFIWSQGVVGTGGLGSQHKTTFGCLVCNKFTLFTEYVFSGVLRMNHHLYNVYLINIYIHYCYLPLYRYICRPCRIFLQWSQTLNLSYSLLFYFSILNYKSFNRYVDQQFPSKLQPRCTQGTGYTQVKMCTQVML